MGIEEMLLERAERRGYEKGLKMSREDIRVKFVYNLFRYTDLDDEKIAMLVGVDVAFVANIKALLNK